MKPPADTPDAGTFLPDFCGLRIVFAVVVMAELLALVLVLATASGHGDRWSEIGLVSLYVQWAALTGTAALCLGRRWLARLGDVRAATLAYLLLLATTALVAALALGLAAWLSFDPFLPAGWRDGFLWRSVVIGAVVAALSLRYFYVRHQWQRQVLAESRAHLEALQARIRPHFLFNSLNTVASLTHDRPQLAESTIEDLAELFRATLTDTTAGVPLRVELELAQRYLNIEALRLGERLRVDWEVAGLDLDAPLPALVVQPLLENAVYHGIEPAPDGGVVRLRGWREGDDNCLSIDNPVTGGAARSDGQQMALDNVRERLAGFFGRPGLLSVKRDAGSFRVELRLPPRAGS
ncbi:MAG TPA: histidine kinase [Gammaproteobacteria bacterium]